MKIISKFILIIFNFNIIKEIYSIKPLLLVLLYDGFRNDYLDRGITPTLSNFRDNGVYAPYLMTVYPAIAEANIHSISTGVYPRSHPYIMRKGKRESQVLSLLFQTKYLVNKPFWVLNQEKGGKSACMMWWSTCVATLECALRQEYDKKWSLRRRADKVIEWLNVTDITQRPNLVLFYVEELDRISHFFGTLSRNTTLMIRRLDLLTKYIFNKLMELNLYHTTNIMILSDHGVRPIMEDNSFAKIYFEKVPDYGFYPREEDKDDINGVYTIAHRIINDEVRERYKKETNKLKYFGDMIPDYTVVSIPAHDRGDLGKIIIEYAALPGYALDLARWKQDQWQAKYATIYNSGKVKLKDPPNNPDRPYGVHGYLRQNDAMFMAKGPQFARYKKVEPFLPVDLYSAFTKLLGIQGDYEMEGNFSRVLPIFREERKIHWTSILVTIAGLAVITTLVFQMLVQQFLDMTDEIWL